MTKASPCAVKTKMKMAKSVKRLMKTKPFDKITVSDITEDCNIHRQTFYYHFQDRYELLEWIIYTDLLLPFMENFSFENMYVKFRTLLETVLSEKEFYRTAFKLSSGEVSDYLSVAAKDLFSKTLKSIGESNNIESQSGDSNMFMAEFIGYGLSGILFSWVNRGMKETPAELTEKVMNMIEICKQYATIY